MKKITEIKWLTSPDKHDYPAAASYLNLIFQNKEVKQLVAKLKKAPVTEFKAKDIFRASRLSLLGISNYHVEKDRNKIKKGIKLSPILLVRDVQNKSVIIADGYHRMCAIYSFNEDISIKCKIV
ncbi:MAG: hypothetical protein JSR09_11425 [Bacteroidetes bacterium]|nr:hypothetical protein [Bacteroidota bacterium]MBS1650303.1 hypothetical protein [Bacteroidota bacterium]